MMQKKQAPGQCEWMKHGINIQALAHDQSWKDGEKMKGVKG